MSKILDAILSRVGYVSEELALKASRSWAILSRDYEHISLESNYTNYAGYQKAYSQLSWVNACVSLIATSGAGVKYYVLDEKDKEVTDRRLLDLLEKPNEREDWYSLSEGLYSDLELTGNSYWVKEETNVYGQPKYLYRLDPKLVKIIPDRQRLIGGYSFEVNGKKIVYQPEEMIHIKYYNPLDPRIGLGKIEACEVLYNTEFASADYNFRFFKQGARLAGVLETDKILAEPEIKRLRAELDKLYGGRKNAHRLGILQGGLKYNATGLSQKDMDFVVQRRFSRDEICAMFFVPPPKLGIMDNANYKAEEADRTFWSECMKPKLLRIQSRLTEDLVKAYNPKWRIEFEEVVKKDEDKESQILDRYLNRGVLTINEAREKLGYEAVPWGDTAYLPLGIAPIDAGSEEIPEKRVRLLSGKGIVVEIDTDRIQPAVIPQEIAEAMGIAEAPVDPNQPHKEAGTKPKAISDRKREVVRKVADARDQIVKTFEPAMAKYFRAEEKVIIGRVLKSFPGDLNVEKLADWKREDDIITKVARPYISTAVKLGAGIASQALSKDPADKKALSEAHREEIIDKLARKVTNVNATTKDKIRKAIEDGITGDFSINEIAYGNTDQTYKGIAGVFAEAIGYRAELIARTETIGAYSEASYETYKDLGVESKEWITAGDDRVSDACLINEGEGAIGVDEVFADGSMYPPAHPNCRCSILPVVE